MNPNIDRHKQNSDTHMYTVWPMQLHTTECTHRNIYTLICSHQLYMHTHRCEYTVAQQVGHIDTHVDIPQQLCPKAHPQSITSPCYPQTETDISVHSHTLAWVHTYLVMHSYRYACININRYRYPLIHKHTLYKDKCKYEFIYQHGHTDVLHAHRHAQTPQACTHNETHIRM